MITTIWSKDNKLSLHSYGLIVIVSILWHLKSSKGFENPVVHKEKLASIGTVSKKLKLIGLMNSMTKTFAFYITARISMLTIRTS